MSKKSKEEDFFSLLKTNWNNLRRNVKASSIWCLISGVERKQLYISWKIKPREKFSRDKKANPNATFWLDWIIKKHLVSSHDDELTSFLQHFHSEIFSARWKMFSQAYCIIFNELKWILLSDGSKQTVWGTRELSELLMNSKCFQIEEGKKFSVPLKLRPIHNCVLNKFAFAAKGRRKHFQHFSDASEKNLIEIAA